MPPRPLSSVAYHDPAPRPTVQLHPAVWRRTELLDASVRALPLSSVAASILPSPDEAPGVGVVESLAVPEIVRREEWEAWRRAVHAHVGTISTVHLPLVL